MADGMMDETTVTATPDLLALNRSVNLTVASAQGICLPVQGDSMHPEGDLVACSLPVSAVAGGVGTQFVCTGWTLSGVVDSLGRSSGPETSLSVSLTNDATLTWNWQAQNWLTVSAGPGGTVPSVGGWYAATSNATVTALPASGFKLAQWTGDVPPANATDNPLPLPMSQARTIAATFAADPTVIVASQTCPGYYSPSTSTVVSCRFAYPADQTLVALTWTPGLPAAWSVAGVSGSVAPH